jgi:hypothetical protein
MTETETETDDVEEAARAAGWKPLSEWRGDASKHIPADRYMLKVAAPRRELEELRNKLSEMETHHSERFARLSHAAEVAIERASGTRIDTIRAAKEQAIAGGDVKAYRELERIEDDERVKTVKDVREARAPVVPAAPVELPETTAWKRENAWFESDPVLRGAALAAYAYAQKQYPHFKEADLLREVDRSVAPVVRAMREPAVVTQPRAPRGGMPDIEGGSSSKQIDPGAGGKLYNLPADEMADCRKAYASLKSKRPDLFKDFDDYMTTYLED